jgi:uncharacterized protein YjiK
LLLNKRITLFITRSSPTSFCCLQLRAKHYPQQATLEHHVSMFLASSEWPSSKPVQSNRQNYSSIAFNPCVLNKNT